MRRDLAGFDLCIFDADDTLRRTTVPGQPCPRRAGEWELLPGVREVLHRFEWQRPGGPQLGLASNQDQVGAGFFTEAAARELLRELARAAAGVTLPEQAIQLCPHALAIACDCRKPRPAMLRRIMSYYGVGRNATVFVGNSEADRGAAMAAGVEFLAAEWVFGWNQSA